ncbi:MAG: hypothetical protein OEW48_09470 [Phycisphaerae bacterium]|nr:hypothetical protein [Phycisphaerae bacterium]
MCNKDNKDTNKKLKVRKKRKFKKRYWLLIDLALAIIVLYLLFYKPARYKPLDIDPAGNNQDQISPYLSNVLLPQLHNGAQRQEPFDLVVIQKGINEAIARLQWPKESNGVLLSAPTVFFVPENIVLMGTASIKGAELVVTIVTKPTLDEQGLLNLRVEKIKIGAMNITPLARLLAKRMYAERVESVPVDLQNLRAKIAASLLNEEPFEPVINVNDIFDDVDEKVRIEKITITQKKLTLRMVPAS